MMTLAVDPMTAVESANTAPKKTVIKKYTIWCVPFQRAWPLIYVRVVIRILSS